MPSGHIIIDNYKETTNYQIAIANHVFLEWNDTYDETEFLKKIPYKYRHPGLIVSYVKDNNIITKMYIHKVIDDKHWKDNNNWKLSSTIKVLSDEQ